MVNRKIQNQIKLTDCIGGYGKNGLILGIKIGLQMIQQYVVLKVTETEA